MNPEMLVREVMVAATAVAGEWRGCSHSQLWSEVERSFDTVETS